MRLNEIKGLSPNQGSDAVHLLPKPPFSTQHSRTCRIAWKRLEPQALQRVSVMRNGVWEHTPKNAASQAVSPFAKSQEDKPASSNSVFQANTSL